MFLSVLKRNFVYFQHKKVRAEKQTLRPFLAVARPSTVPVLFLRSLGFLGSGLPDYFTSNDQKVATSTSRPIYDST